MNKKEFLEALGNRLTLIGAKDKDNTLEYYSEMIDDRMEEGLSEQEAVSNLGDIDDIISKIIYETPISDLVKAKVKTNRALRIWEIILLILGFPLWFPLIIAFFVIFLSIYIVIWSVVVSLYSAVVGLGACGVGFIAGMIVIAFTSGFSPSILLLIGSGMASLGFAILFSIGTNQVTKGVIWLSKKILLGIKSCFVKKEEQK